MTGTNPVIKVLHFSQTLPGGPASYFEEIAPSQIKIFGAENVRFIIPARHRDMVPSIPDESTELFTAGGRDLISLLRLGILLSRAISSFEPDIVHLHSTFAGFIGRVAVILRCRKRPIVVYCAHGWAFAMEVSWWKRRFYVLVERVLAYFTDAIINISNSECEAAVRRKFPSKRLATIVNGVGEHRQEDAGEVQLAQNQINLLFVGRHDPQKGLDVLFNSMRQLKNGAHLHVLGGRVVSSGPEPANSDNVTFHGWVTRGLVYRYMSACDAVVVPSRWEGFGLVAVEAMRMGVAVIASNRGALPELVDHKRSGLIFDFDRPDELTAILRNLSKSELRQYGEAGRRRYELFYTAERMNDELMKLYFKILSHSARNTANQELNVIFPRI